MLRPVLHQPAVIRHLGHVLSALRDRAADLPTDPVVRDLAHGLQATATIARGETRSPAEDHAYISSHPHVSLVQALLEESAHTGRFSTHDDETQPAAAPAEVPGRLARWQLQHPGETPFDDFQPWDIRWLKVVEELIECWRERIDFSLAAAPPVTFPLAADARILVLSDWGNGSDVAWQVSEHVKEWLHSAGDRECHVVHLGDVYYAGTPWEAHHRFLDFWPVEPDHPAHHYSWCLNGNHDMYAAGRGLTGTILTDERFSRQRATNGEVSTQLLLRGTDWQLVGLDSSWKFDVFDIGGLYGRLGSAQAQWFGAVTTEFAPGRTIALSHHQPVSRLHDYPADLTLEHTLIKDSAQARASGLFAWFWGHEHRCISYQGEALATIPGLGYGACVGYSAMPEYASTVTKGPGEWEYDGLQPIDHDGDIWRTCGFAVVDLGPGTATVTYVDQSGTTIRTDQLPTSPAVDPA